MEEIIPDILCPWCHNHIQYNSVSSDRGYCYACKISGNSTDFYIRFFPFGGKEPIKNISYYQLSIFDLIDIKYSLTVYPSFESYSFSIYDKAVNVSINQDPDYLQICNILNLFDKLISMKAFL